MHLGWEEISRALGNIHATGAAHLLVTTFTRTKRNADIGPGGWWPMNLELPPFSLPAPLEVFVEDPPKRPRPRTVNRHGLGVRAFERPGGQAEGLSRLHLSFHKDVEAKRLS